MQALPRLRPAMLTLTAFAVISMTLVAPALYADQPAGDAEKAAQRVNPPVVALEAADVNVPAPSQGATVSPDAKRVIDQVDAAYSGIQRLALAGTFSTDIDASGQKTQDSRSFTATYAAPNKFRHAMQDDMLVGSTGDKTYAYLEGRNLFQQFDAARDKVEIGQLPGPISQILQMQNPALMLALVKSAAAALSGTFTDIKKVEDTKLADEAAYPTLMLTLPNRMVVTMLFHPETHLLRQSRTNIKPMLEERGTPDVKNATLVVDYTTVRANDGAAVKDEQFAWAPPQGARELAEAGIAAGPIGAPGEGSPLVGKPAPAFSLKDMAGKTVTLADLKGKVVVLDVWATWCPPCRASLPHLDKLYEETKGKAIAIYAVNFQEDKADVEAFIQETKLKTPVLLDPGPMAEAYQASAIPQTIVIGKDGKVAKVLVGFSGEESAKALEQAIEQAMK